MKRVITDKEDDGTVRVRKEITYPNIFEDDRGYQFWRKKQATKVFANVPFPKVMTDAEIGKMTKLSKHIYRDSNILAYRGNGGMRPYDVAGIGKLLEIEERQAYRFVSKMIDLGVMARAQMEIGGNSEAHYFINPVYYFAGTWLNHTLYMLFREQLDKVLPEYIRYKFQGYTGEVRSYAGKKVH